MGAHGLDVGELSGRAKEILGEGYEQYIDETLGSAPKGADERVRAAVLVEAMVGLCGIPGPMVVTGFLPPWYPHRANLGATHGENIMERPLQRQPWRWRAVSKRLLRSDPSSRGSSDLS